MTFNEWIDTFISEKEFDLEHEFVVETEQNTHFIELGVVIETIKQLPADIRNAIKTEIVKIDFSNPNAVLGYFGHLAKAVAKMYEEG